MGITNRTKLKAIALAQQYNISNVYDSAADAVKFEPAKTIYDITILPEQFVETLQQLPTGRTIFKYPYFIKAYLSDLFAYLQLKSFLMEFITTDCKLTIEGTTISQKRLTNEYRRNLVIYAFLFAFGLNMLVEKFEIARQAGKASKWIMVIFLCVLMLPVIGMLLDFLFRQHWTNKIDISKIVEIKTYQSEEALETNVAVKLKSKRYKVYTFRTLERQFENFIVTLQSINPTSQLIKE